jgi:hypothetical protein
MMDVVYFGYAWEDDSPKLEKEFKELIVAAFPNVKLKNAFDEIKGYRQEVWLPDEKKDDYYAWVIADGWAQMSLTLLSMSMDKTQKDKLQRILELAKFQYSDKFKQD